MSRARRLFKGIRELYEEYGVPLVNEIMDEFGPEQAQKVRFPEKVRQEAQKRAAQPVRRGRAGLAPQVKALPAPTGEPLPDYAVKPKGGQWQRGGAGLSMQGLDRSSYSDYAPEIVASETTPSGLLFSSGPTDHALRDWYKKALTKYVKTDFGTPDDPIRDLAGRGLAHVPDLTPERWSELAKNTIYHDAIGDHLLPPNPRGGMPGAGSDLRADSTMLMPWLAKQPVTDRLYGIHKNEVGNLQFGHVADELRQAMNPEVYGIPEDLAVRPESLSRMSFPQAVERVGKINQFRAKKMEEETLSNLNSPAVQMFKEYPDDPSGMRWVELRPPELTEFPEGFRAKDRGIDGEMRWEGYSPEVGYIYAPDEAGLRRQLGQRDKNMQQALQDQLTFEGDTMGHCVGGYCGDVLGGMTRIFSLRDAKGMPHVTVETERGIKGMSGDLINSIEPGLWEDMVSKGAHYDSHRWLEQNRPDIYEKAMNKINAEDIIQIKGKQNRKPNEEYLPFVQDFVKSGNWGRVGDVQNTGLRRYHDELVDENEFNAKLQDELSFLKTLPLGRVREAYGASSDYGGDLYEERNRLINRTVLPRYDGEPNYYSINEVMGVLEDPGAWDEDVLDTVLGTVRSMREHGFDPEEQIDPRLYEGFAVGGRVNGKKCGCASCSGFSVR